MMELYRLGQPLRCLSGHVLLYRCGPKASPHRSSGQCSMCGRIWGCASLYATSSKTKKKSKIDSEEFDLKLHSVTSSETRMNAANVQMLSESLHRQIFKRTPPQHPDPQTFEAIKKHLSAFKLWDKTSPPLQEVNFQLPELYGNNIDEHFRILAEKQTETIRKHAEVLAGMTKFPPRPKNWILRKGWTKYDPKKGIQRAVEYPHEDVLVFDVEIVVSGGNFPTMATAVSPNAWYSWCSERVLHDSNKWDRYTSDEGFHPEGITPNDLVPMESRRTQKGSKRAPRLVVGHNVGFDRAYVKEQYHIQGLNTKFLDTMSMHIALSGQTSLQRVLYMAHKKGSRPKEVREHEDKQKMFNKIPRKDWIEDSSLNSLAEVFSHYYPDQPALQKATRDIFVKGQMSDIRQNFQELMHYCANDVLATAAIFRAIWPTFLHRFPHPVTLAGMMEMGSTYLPVDQDWFTYINSAQAMYEEYQGELLHLLKQLADEACQYAHNDRYKDDVWLWDLDWTVKQAKQKKLSKPQKSLEDREQNQDEQVQAVLDNAVATRPGRAVHMPGYPKWYTALCPKQSEIAEGHSPGPSKISTQMRVAPKLLRLVWDGFPLHYSDEHGWGYLVPRSAERGGPWEAELNSQEEELNQQEAEVSGKKKKTIPEAAFPVHALIEVVKQTKPEWLATVYPEESKPKVDTTLGSIHYSTGEEEAADQSTFWESLGYGSKKKNNNDVKADHLTEERFTDVIPGVDFYKLPHKDGKNKRVGNPLAKDFLPKIEEGILRSLKGQQAESVLRYSNVCSYWKMNVDRIKSQIVVTLPESDLPDTIKKSPDYQGQYLGVILPKVITAGTVTRRAVEGTWLTASNAYPDRIGSELKAMVHSPPGYHFVGADVDSQELWIASVLGDAYFAGIHGSTALGWMVLQGNKKDGTDMHSMTASLAGITRDHAKIFNYGRIYGAGTRFAKQLLMQFNHRLSEQEAAIKAKVMYAKTKGKMKRVRFESDPYYDGPEISIPPKWEGGSESHMFNQLEAIARSDVPRTPVLDCTISKALEPRNVDTDFMPSRINWVVQSSAVDYLHLMLVSMRWLLDEYNIDGRFSISIHDEVRYLVSSEDRYRAALALQITNLLTRSMFAYKLGMYDLPQAVAFFSAVDLDTCLRKEAHLDCVTPSNPSGLQQGYSIQPGEALTIHEVLEKTGGSLKA